MSLGRFFVVVVLVHFHLFEVSIRSEWIFESTCTSREKFCTVDDNESTRLFAQQRSCRIPWFRMWIIPLGAGLSCAAAANMCALLWSQPYPLSICANLQRTVNYLANLTLSFRRKGNFVEKTKRKRSERIFEMPQQSFLERELATCIHVLNSSGKRTNCTFNTFCQGLGKIRPQKSIFLSVCLASEKGN